MNRYSQQAKSLHPALRMAFRLAAFSALLGTAAVLGPPDGSAREAERAALNASVQAWENCTEKAESLADLRDSLGLLAHSLTTARQAAADRGASGQERRLLARGEAVAESIRAVSAAQLAQELLCAPVAAALLESLDARLRRPEVLIDEALRDSLLGLRARLLRDQAPAARVDFTAAQAREDDPPEILKQKAAFARDLADRVERCLALVAGERQRLADHGRILAEARQLVGDEGFLGEGAGFDMLGWGDPPGLGDESSGARKASGPAGLFTRLIEQMPSQPVSQSPEEILEMLEMWLQESREDLSRLAGELESEAERREREP